MQTSRGLLKLILNQWQFYPLLLLLLFPLWSLLHGASYLAFASLLAALIVLAWLGARQLSNLKRLENAARHLGEGDLSYQLSEQDAGMFHSVVHGINRMGEDVGRTILSLVNTADAMKSVAMDIKSISDAAHIGVEEQEKQAELAATAMTQMVSTVQEVSRNAASAANAAEEARQAARSGDQTVRQVVRQIDDMSAQVGQTQQVIARLAEDSNNISTIIDTISQVAEQTNLLALNAAIESARAGEHGRGFAVVADEVRSLAQRTSAATVEIQQQILQLQQGADEGVKVMTTSVEQASATHAMAHQAQQALGQIVAQIESITDMSHQIAAASEQQQAVAEEISSNISSMAQVAVENAKETHSTNLSSLKVFNMSQEISSLLGRFHVDKRAMEQLEKRHRFVEWGPQLDLGMEEINRQHQRLVSLINELHRTLEEAYGLEAIKRIVQGLVDYTANHFAYEEELFARFGYPQTEQHKLKHQQLVAKVLDFQKRVANGEDVADELMAFLKSWLINHIQGSDKEYTSFLIARGAQ
ncbi:bacteriohemerythrin [Shewanella algae]|uniref:bacteriohemerythrin n=1 Tax=Shewanella algae TaxID=38313 RepID=UPI0005CD260A|nr:bacteriohemerythrin [Shewanella algae]MBO2648438.1 bacteriohemerythrin [Shewanella algae]BCV52505.1 chemotaxis protein [Shewanella algae]